MCWLGLRALGWVDATPQNVHCDSKDRLTLTIASFTISTEQSQYSCATKMQLKRSPCDNVVVHTDVGAMGGRGGSGLCLGRGGGLLGRHFC